MPVKMVGFTELASKLGHVASDMTSINARATKKAADKAKVLATAAVSPKSLSRWGRGSRRGGYSVKARDYILGPGEAKLKPSPAPLAGLLERGSYKAGSTWKAPKRRGSPRRAKGSVGSYTHAPVPARGAWKKAEVAVKARWPHDYEVAVNAELRKILSDFTRVV